ncbi:MAG: 23S rRNA pseudouridine955/2504/2580 synthase [Candidatus Azotimanducaceae bacterium]|jgi:23S rRNA pseudouridine955/2504/2580 synthase
MLASAVVEVVTQDDEGQRVDNFLLARLKGVPRTHVYKILRSGEVRVNSGRIKASYRVKLGDKVRIPPVRKREEVPVRLQRGIVKQLVDSVLFEDDNYLVINKPAGIAVHGGSSLASGAIEQLRLAYDNPRLALVHRLDRATTGCLLISKRTNALKVAQAAFRDRQVSKIYLGIVWGHWPTSTHVLQARLERYETASGERRVRVSSEGQQARTDVEVLSKGKALSRLQLRLHTGRTHQIRVHLSHHGFPLVGDDKYGARQTDEATRLCLHAHKLDIQTADIALKVVAPPPDDWESLWESYDKKP